MITELLIHLTKIAAVLGVMLTIVAYTVLLERWVCAWMQDRIGPNRVGPWGLLQPLADFGKLVLKEDVLPWHVHKFYYTLAPALTMIPALLTIAVVPWGSRLPIAGRMIDCVIANLDVGILFIFAIASLGVYGIVLAGWASNSKYPFLGGVRSSAQMISYEVCLGLSVVPVFMQVGSLNLMKVVEYQAQHTWLILLSAVVVLYFHGERVCGDEPVAVRLPGGGTGARRGLQHRIQLDEVRHVLHGRVREHVRGVGADGDAVFGRLVAAVRAVQRARANAGRRAGADRRFSSEDDDLPVRVHLGALDDSAISL